MKAKLKHHALAALLCIAFTAEVRAQLPNAWQINDNLTTAGFIQYVTDLTTDQWNSALIYGWRYTLVSRMVADSGAAASHSMAFGTGSRRFYIFFDLDSSGRLTAQLLGDATYTLTSAAEGTNYHTHELQIDPFTQQVTYRFDDVAITSWPGEDSGGQSKQGMWGANSSTGRGVMNYQRAEFEIPGLGIIAAYNAGYAGNPATAPSPTTQGWTRFTSGSAISETPVSPDTVPLPLKALTWPPSEVSATTATLNVQLFFAAMPVDYYFEYGSSTNYGSFTATNTVTLDTLSKIVGAGISGLEPMTPYHFRAVAQDSNGVAIGDDLTFSTHMFSRVPIANLPEIANGSLAWADFDNDGRLDFFLTGEINYNNYVSQVWRNANNGFFDVTANVTTFPFLIPLRSSSVTWGDYDNDGHLDFLLTGGTEAPTTDIAQIWRNMGGAFGNVTASVAPGLPGVSAGSVAWGDYDNDGRLDFLITGSGYVSQLWRNTGSGFINVTATVAPGLPQVAGSVAWADFDNDGQLDFLITGGKSSAPYSISQLWRNTGSRFTNVTATVAPGLPQVSSGAVAWGDYDNDGRLDFLITGLGSYRISQLWRNTGGGFSNVTASVAPDLLGVTYGLDRSSVAWGDYDNDGRLDFLIMGYNGILAYNYVSFVGQIWRNTDTGFSNVTVSVVGDLPAVGSGKIAWADYDNDGRLDFLVMGYNDDPYNGKPPFSVCQLWRNLTATTNTPPTAPTGLAMTTSSNGVLLSWNAATDAQTPSSGLSYNVRAGTTPGGTDLLATHANAVTGFRRVPALGNAQMRHFLPLAGVTNGQTVYWSVQAVDTSFAGGPFATVSSFVVAPPALNILSTGTNAIISWQPSYPGWILQESLSLSPPAWSNSPSGSTNPVAILTTNGAKFHRLFKP
jgi:hypothetical protein